MGFFDFIEDVIENESRKRERRRDTEDYIEAAKRYIRDGQDLYERAYSDTISYANETEYKLNQHYDFKRKIIKEISSDINPILTQFTNFNIDSKIIETPSIDRDLSSGLDILKGVTSCITPSYPIPSIFDLFADVDEDYYEAKRQRDEAKYFYEDMKYERQKLRAMKDNMRAVREFIADEKQLIEKMVSKLNNVSQKLKLAMGKKEFLKEEAAFYKELHRIANSINNLVSTKFLNDNFTITNQYQLVFNKIKEIDATLSAAPEISNDTSDIKKILRMLENMPSK